MISQLATQKASTSLVRQRLADKMQAEVDRFVRSHPASAAHVAQSRHLLGGVPMPWMARWPGPFPVIVDSAAGAHFVDIDGNDYIDLCMGDTGAMTGHSLPDVAAAVALQAERGFTTMLPSPDASWVADELKYRFGLARWQFALSATDANRFVLRLARQITGRRRILVFNWCYHGTVDETLAVLDEHGRVVPRHGALGPAANVADTTAVVEFNDIDALQAELAKGDIACVLMEPALTNIGIVLPAPGFHEAVRTACDETGTLLVIDETHTICAGPGGATAAWGLRPDMLVIGKPIGGGVPVATYGMTEECAAALESPLSGDVIDVSGIGGTLAGNALSLAAVRATLSNHLTPKVFAHAEPLAAAWAEGVRTQTEARGLAWTVQRLGCRAEYWIGDPPSNGREAAAASDHELEAFLHLHALNRGILLTPFHNMALFSQFHTQADVDRHTEVFGEALDDLRV